MNIATITVKKIFPPNKGGFSGIISSDDIRFSAKGENIVSQFREGGKYDITYEETTTGQYTNRTIRTVKTLSAPATNGTAAPAANAGRYGATDPATSENIFVCGMMNALATAGAIKGVNADDIANMTHGLRMGWRRGLAPTQPAQTRTRQESQDELDDEIPFS